jgi:hypothetical protein
MVSLSSLYPSYLLSICFHALLCGLLTDFVPLAFLEVYTPSGCRDFTDGLLIWRLGVETGD